MTSNGPYRIPTSSIPQAANGHDAQPKKRLSSRISSMLSKSDNTKSSEDHLSRELTRASTRSSSKRRWWRILWFRGMYNDIRRRLPFYWSDWKDAWDYRVIPATVYMYFAKYVQINWSLTILRTAHVTTMTTCDAILTTMTAFCPLLPSR